jgi:hypothetical protein
MKKLLFAISILLSISMSAQNYNDTTITLQLTQRAALYIGRSIQQSFSWQNRNAPTQLKAYIGSGANYDSLVGNVSVKASYVKGMIEMLLNLSGAIVEADKLSIINNSPSIPGYTALANQIVTKANGSSSEKQVAIFIRDYYNERVAAYGAVRLEAINSTVQWANN